MTNEIKDKICRRCKRRRYFVKKWNNDFDWRTCDLICHKKCKMKEQKNG